MKSNCNFVVCFGVLMMIGGLIVSVIMLSSLSYNPDNQYTLGYQQGVVIGLAIMFAGLLLIIFQFRSVTNWNKVVGIAKAQNKISMKEMSLKSGVPEAKVGPIIYEAIASGDLSGTMEGDTFSRSKPSATSVSSDVKVLVICPYCGGKTEQGIPKCQECGAKL